VLLAHPVHAGLFPLWRGDSPATELLRGEPVTPFIDLHVLRDGTTELSLYGDDGALIACPTADTVVDAVGRLQDAVNHLSRHLDPAAVRRAHAQRWLTVDDGEVQP
jgi:hypothetical protein